MACWGSRVFSAVPNKNAARIFRPVAVPFATARTLNFEQWASVLGLVSTHHLEAVTTHMLTLAQKTSRDPISVVLLAGCRYMRWRVSDPEGLNAVRTFLRFVIGQLDSHRDIPERVLHISTLGSVVSRLNFTNVYAKQDILSIFQVEVTQIYAMCVRWSKQDDLKDASYLLLANIFARCPSTFLMKSHNFIAKRLVGPFTSSEKARRSIEAHLHMLRGAHARKQTGWLPDSATAAGKFKHWSARYAFSTSPPHFLSHSLSSMSEVRRLRRMRKKRPNDGELQRGIE